ncbi:hypothetical protein [Paenibacillus tyrfis]|uniref:hypothetical protein n=1 Tax=Paenibacillus tyrfis TaxID=1501230 RepID=UPI000B58DEA6|nr:hypothetical protein [Paenibacillus tyrfis]
MTMGIVLKNRLEHSVEKMLSDVIVSVFRSNLKLVFGNRLFYNKDGSLRSVEMTISDRPLYLGDTENFTFWIERIDEKYVNEKEDEEYDWVDEGKNLYQVGYIENIRDIEGIVYKFVYEYLKLNPNDYFWFEDYAFCYKDMEKLSKLPYNPDWCYTNPRLV